MSKDHNGKKVYDRLKREGIMRQEHKAKKKKGRNSCIRGCFNRVLKVICDCISFVFLRSVISKQERGGGGGG